jgi:hypothetical protein
MDPRDPTDDDFDELEEDEDDGVAAGPSYRLPADMFQDPFESDDGPSGKPPEVFLPAYLGLEDDEIEQPPSLSAQAVAAPNLSFKERLARMAEGVGEGSKQGSSRFAGADVSAPSFLARLRSRRKAQESTVPPLGELAAPQLSLDDPFARLLTPLAGPELARLQAEVANDEVLFVRYERTRKAALRRQSHGLAFALLMLVLFLLFAGRGYLDHKLVNARVPHWLVNFHHLGATRAGGILFVVGLLLPFLTLGTLADTFTHMFKAISERSLVDLCLSVLSACFAAAVLLLLVHALPFQAAAVLAVWVAFRFIINLVTGGRD